MSRILIVDDNDLNLELLGALLRGNGYEVDQARHGAEALARARQQPPDLVMSDLLMPVMDGYMLLRHWRADDRLAALPFLVYTATYTDPKDEQLAFDLGADAFVIKPAEPDAILAAVNDLLERGPSSEDLKRARAAADPVAALQAYSDRVGSKLQRKLLELEQARQALRQTDDLYSSLFENNHAVMLLIDPKDGAIIDANPAACHFYGWSRESLRRKRISDLDTLPADEVEAEMRRAQYGDRPYFAFRHRLADDRVRDVEVYSGPILVRGRSLLYSIVHDVTERREAQRQLERSERLTGIASRLAHVGGWEVDLAERRVYWSDEVCRIHGLPTGTTVTVDQGVDFYAPEWRDRIREVFTACAREGTPYDEELQILTVDGRRVWVRTIGSAVRDTDRRITAVHGAFQDISDRIATQEQLRQLWLAVEQSSESIVITDLEPRIQYVNEAFCRNSGYTRAELIGQNPRLLHSGKTPAETYDDMWAALSTGRSWRGEFYNRHKDGDEYVELASVSPVRQADGRITHYLGVKEDITDKRRVAEELDQHRHHLEEMVEQRTRELVEARRQAETANQAKSTFLANMSHEIRTPMNGVLGMVEVLAQHHLSPQQAELVGTIRDSGKALLAIIEDILDFSKIEAGHMELESAPVSIAPLVESLCDSLMPMALARGVDASLFISPAVPAQVLSDEVRLRQILYNLLGNAIKFSSGRRNKRGRIALRIEVKDEHPLVIRFAISDNGIGMAPDVIERLFRPFSQAEESTTRRFGGTGLGLTICKRLVDLMHGEISVQTEPGKGAEFRVDLPFEVPDGQPTSDYPDLQGIYCLLVEDRELRIEDLTVYLEHAGARVRCVPSVDVAVDHVRSLDPADGPVVILRYVERGAVTALPSLSAPAHVRQLHIRRGRRRRARIESGDIVSLDGAALRRRALLQGVAIAAGRMSPDGILGKAGSLGAASHLPPPSTDEARARGELILVAEDDDINQKVITKQLELLGRACEIATDGSEALAMWRAGRYALLLTDLHMPEMDGYMLTEAIRREETVRAEQHGGEVERLPILALTANALRGEAEHAYAIGMDDYLTKPLQLDRLNETLARWLPPVAAAPATEQQDHRPDATPAILDRAVLRSLIGDDPAKLESLLHDFVDSANSLLNEYHGALAANDAAGASAVGHKLKSSSRSVGALALGEICATIERVGKAGDLERLTELGAQLADAVRAVASKVFQGTADSGQGTN